MKLSRAKIRKIIMEAMEDAAGTSALGGGEQENVEDEETQSKEVENLLGSMQKAPSFEMYWGKINNLPKFQAVIQKLVDSAAKEPMKGKEQDMKTALTRIASTL